MKKLLLVLLALSVCCGCVIYTMTYTFDPQLATQMLDDGKYNISGTAFVRQREGSIITCAGLNVKLYPATPYAKERAYLVYRNIDSGFVWDGFGGVPRQPHSQDDRQYLNINKSALCNYNGEFRFKNVKNGEYFIISNIIWTVSKDNQTINNNGSLMLRVTVKDQDVDNVILAKQLYQ